MPSMKDRSLYCFLPEGRRCPEMFEQCEFCQWVEEEIKEQEKQEIA